MMRSSAPHSTAAPEKMIRSMRSSYGMLRLSLGGAPEQARPSLLREFSERMGVCYDAEPMGDAPFEIDITVRALLGLQLLSGRMQGSRTRRTRVSNDPTDDLGLMVNLRGPQLISQRGREIVLGNRAAALVSLVEPLVTTQGPPGELMVLRFPRPSLAPFLTDAGQAFLRPVSRDTPGLSLLTDYIDVARDEDSIADAALQQLMVTHLFDLMAVTLGPTRDAAEVARGRGVKAARLYAIKHDIAKNLGSPDLTVAALAARHHCTSRSIQRLFESEGVSFTDYVLAKRLARAHARLTDRRRADEKISAVAYDCGFGDLSYFNRAFRRRYGAAPSDLRAHAHGAS